MNIVDILSLWVTISFPCPPVVSQGCVRLPAVEGGDLFKKGAEPDKPDIKRDTLTKENTKKLITIGESLHASIARCGGAMQRLLETGADNEAKAYIISVIESQAAAGADFIEVNVDKFGELGFDTAAAMMRQYVTMIATNGGGSAACIDSSDDTLLLAGLEAWYQAGCRKKPLINSIKVSNADAMLAVSAEMPFAFVALLMEGSCSLLSQAAQIFDKAIAAGFRPQDIYFDTGAFPLAIDLPMLPGEKGRTYTAFETMKAIKNNPKFAGVHFSLGISNCARDLPSQRAAVIKAYLHKAMDYGLDAAIIDVRKDWFECAPDKELTELVSAFAALDGSQDALMNAMTLMTDFCNRCRNAGGVK